MVDENGAEVDGDQIMALIGGQLAARGELRGGGVVATVMSNLGLERCLNARGLALLRTAVGDRNVLEAMRRGGYNVGGEQSGHMIMPRPCDHRRRHHRRAASAAALVKSGKRASELLHQFDAVPQLLKNVRFSGASLWMMPASRR